MLISLRGGDTSLVRCVSWQSHQICRCLRPARDIPQPQRNAYAPLAVPLPESTSFHPGLAVLHAIHPVVVCGGIAAEDPVLPPSRTWSRTSPVPVHGCQVTVFSSTYVPAYLIRDLFLTLELFCPRNALSQTFCSTSAALAPLVPSSPSTALIKTNRLPVKDLPPTC